MTAPAGERERIKLRAALADVLESADEMLVVRLAEIAGVYDRMSGVVELADALLATPAPAPVVGEPDARTAALAQGRDG